MSDNIVEQALDLFYDPNFWEKVLNTTNKEKSEELAWKIHDMLPEGELAATILSALHQATLIVLLECLLNWREKKEEGDKE
ncbi:MAG: hypothetical protein ACP5KV_07345 [Candidatus Methanomethylicaceae archaeon]